MSLKTSKSKSLIFEEGKIIYNKSLSITQNSKTELILSVHSNPVKFLGRTINFHLSDKNQIETVSKAISTAINLIDKSKHRGVHKVWILQHLLIPRLRWPLLIYDFSVSTVLKFEQKISTYIRRYS